MNFVRSYKPILLSIFIAFIPSTVYPVWGLEALSQGVSNLWARATVATKKISAQVAVLGAALTVGTVGLLYWFKKNKARVRKVQRPDCQDVTQPVGLNKADVDSYEEGDELDSEKQNPTVEENWPASVVVSHIPRVRVRGLLDLIDEDEMQVSTGEDSAGSSSSKSSSDTDETDSTDVEGKYSADTGWDIYSGDIEQVRSRFAQLYDHALDLCQSFNFKNKTLEELEKIRDEIGRRKEDLSNKQRDLFIALQVRCNDVDIIYQSLEEEYKVNSQTILNNSGLTLAPHCYYTFLELAKKEGKQKSASEMKKLIESRLSSGKESESKKNVLRQLTWVFYYPYKKEHFDAFLEDEHAKEHYDYFDINKGTLAQLVIHEQDRAGLIDSLKTINEEKMGIASYLDTLNRTIESKATH